VLAARAIARGEPVQQVIAILAFAVAFCGAGFGLMAAGIWGKGRVEKEEALQARHPAQPWLWREEWASRRIPERSRSSAVTLWILALIWNAVSTPLLFVVPQELRDGNRLAVIGFLFPLAGIFLIVAAFGATARAIRFHQSALLLDEVPVPVGGVLRGRVEIPMAGDAFLRASSVVAHLTCLNRTSDSDSTTESVKWQEEDEIGRHEIQRSERGVAIPIEIELPEDAAASSERPSSDMIVWRLTVDADLPGIDYNGSFDVPVFRREGAIAHRAKPRTPLTRPDVETVRERATPDGLEIHFPPFRARGVAYGTLVFTAIWIGAIALMLDLDAPLIFPIMFGLFAVLLVMIMLDLFFGTSTVSIDGERVTILRRLLLYRSSIDLPRDAVADVQLKIGMQTTAGRARPYYDIQLVTTRDRKITAGKFLRSKREAEWVAARIRSAALGGARPPSEVSPAR
jgi:hypothetical protein